MRLADVIHLSDYRPLLTLTYAGEEARYGQSARVIHLFGVPVTNTASPVTPGEAA